MWTGKSSLTSKKNQNEGAVETYVGMTYGEWAKVQQPKTEVRRQSERAVEQRAAFEGMQGVVETKHDD